MEELDEILGEINDEDQTLLVAGIGGVNKEDEDEALRLQEQLSRQRQQRDRTPPRPDVLQSRVARQVHRDRAEEDGDDGRPVFPEPPQPLPLPSPSGIDLDTFI